LFCVVFTIALDLNTYYLTICFFKEDIYLSASKVVFLFCCCCCCQWLVFC